MTTNAIDNLKEMMLRPNPRKTRFQGMDITIENPAGSVRRGRDKDGKPWQTRMVLPYGYIHKANGADGEGLDCYIGHNKSARDVYVIHQNDPTTGQYDEDKIFVGMDSPEAARTAYLLHYNRPEFYRSTTIIPVKDFREMLTTAKPGSVHWKKKQKRERMADAIFSADTTDDGEWKTINGAHVLIKDGIVSKGPHHLVGKTPRHVESHGKPPTKRGGFHAVERDATGKHKGGDPSLTKRFDSLKIPPAWTDVHLSEDPAAKLQAIGIDSKGRTQYRYSTEHSGKAAAEKFARTKKLIALLPTIDKHIQNNSSEEAAVLRLIRKTGLRIGGDADTGADKQAYGATTLLKDHVKDEGGKTKLDFVGKKGVNISHDVDDEILANELKERAKSGGKLYNTTDAKVRDYLHGIAPGFKVKDLRTVVATEEAQKAISDIPSPTDLKSYVKAITEVGKMVSAKLGNTPTVALASYIPPEVFSGWRFKVANAEQADLIQEYAKQKGINLESAAKEWIPQHASAYRKNFNERFGKGGKPAALEPKRFGIERTGGNNQLRQRTGGQAVGSDAGQGRPKRRMTLADVKRMVIPPRSPNPSFSAEDLDGHWITIGGHVSNIHGTTAHTGTHIFITDSGQIAKGPPDLKGKPIAALSSDKPSASKIEPKLSGSSSTALPPSEKGERGSTALPPSRMNQVPGETAKEGEVGATVSGDLAEPSEPATNKSGKAPKPFSPKDLRAKLLAAHQAEGGGIPLDVQRFAESLQNPFVFHKDSPYRGEVRQMVGGKEGGKEGTAIARSGAISFTDDPRKSGGEDAIGAFKEKYGKHGEEMYWQMARDRAGLGFKDALESARNSQDPQTRLLAAMYDTLPPASQKVVQEPTAAGELQPGQAFEINRVPVQVVEDEDGNRILKDEGDLPDTPLDALQTVPVDKGSLHDVAPAPEDLGGDFAPGGEPKQNPPESQGTAGGPQTAPAADQPQPSTHPPVVQPPQPWERSPQEIQHEMETSEHGSPDPAEVEKALARHQMAVEDALLQGKPVPQKVLDGILERHQHQIAALQKQDEDIRSQVQNQQSQLQQKMRDAQYAHDWFQKRIHEAKERPQGTPSGLESPLIQPPVEQVASPEQNVPRGTMPETTPSPVPLAPPQAEQPPVPTPPAIAKPPQAIAPTGPAVPATATTAPMAEQPKSEPRPTHPAAQSDAEIAESWKRHAAKLSNRRLQQAIKDSENWKPLTEEALKHAEMAQNTLHAELSRRTGKPSNPLTALKEKMAQVQKDKQGREKRMIEPGRWDVPPVGKMSILHAVGAPAAKMQGGKMVLDEKYLRNVEKLNPEQIARYQQLVAQYNAGQRLADVNLFPDFARYADLKDMAQAGQSLPEKAVARIAAARGISTEQMKSHFAKMHERAGLIEMAGEAGFTPTEDGFEKPDANGRMRTLTDDEVRGELGVPIPEKGPASQPATPDAPSSPIALTPAQSPSKAIFQQAQQSEQPAEKAEADRQARMVFRQAGNMSHIVAKTANGTALQIYANALGRNDPNEEDITLANGRDTMPISSVHEIYVDGKKVWKRPPQPASPTSPIEQLKAKIQKPREKMPVQSRASADEPVAGASQHGAEPARAQQTPEPTPLETPKKSAEPIAPTEPAATPTQTESAPASPSKADVDLNRQQGLFQKTATGEHEEIGKRPGQGNLFNPNKYRLPESEKEPEVKPQFDKKHTMEMFPEKAEETTEQPQAPAEAPKVVEEPKPTATAPKNAKRTETIVGGDRAEYTGNTVGVGNHTFHEVEIMEGPFKGQKKVVPSPPSNPNQAQQENAARAQRERSEYQEGFRKLHQASSSKPPNKPPTPVETAAAAPEPDKKSSIVDAWDKAQAMEHEGSWDRSARENYRDSFIKPLGKRLQAGEWKPAADYVAGSYKSLQSPTAKIARDLGKLVKAGAVQRAWDAQGNPHYAIAGTPLPNWLTMTENPPAAATPTSEPPPIQAQPTPVENLKRQIQKQRMVEDFGDKIGGARKDLARPLGPRKAKDEPEDTRPGWHRPYKIHQGTNGKYFITYRAKGDPKHQQLLNRIYGRGVDYDTAEEAEKAIPLMEAKRNHGVYGDDKNGYAIRRILGERKSPVVKGGFKTREEAEKHLAEHPTEIIEHKFPFPDEIEHLKNVERTGPERRQGDVKPTDFQKTFDFRGGEFGNWNQGKEGQEVLNHAYDGLHDMAEVLGLPPKAISLNGQLAIGFGSRGTGGKHSAKAHYEPDRNVINMTKIKGAGSLAHEWFHALDRYVAQQAEGSPLDKVSGKYEFATHGSHPGHKARQEVVDAFKNLMDTMISKKAEKELDPAFESKRVEQTQSGVKRVLDGIGENLTNRLASSRIKTRPFSDDERKEWSELKEKIIRGDLGEKTFVKGRDAFGGYESFENIDRLNALYKKVTGQSFLRAEPDSQGRRLIWQARAVMDAEKRLEEAKKGAKETKKQATDYFNESRKIDSYRASNYYSLPHEMAARAFASYIQDQIEGKGNKSQYLAYGSKNNFLNSQLGKPYPEGDERKAIHDAMEKLFKAIKVEKATDEKGRETDRMFAAELGLNFDPIEQLKNTMNGRRLILIDNQLRRAGTANSLAPSGRPPGEPDSISAAPSPREIAQGAPPQYRDHPFLDMSTGRPMQQKGTDDQGKPIPHRMLPAPSKRAESPAIQALRQKMRRPSSGKELLAKLAARRNPSPDERLRQQPNQVTDRMAMSGASSN
jgi:DNA topoisomerase IB